MKKDPPDYDGSTALADARWELFVGHLIAGVMPDYECVTAAGFKTKTPDNQAVRLKGYASIKARMSYLLAQVTNAVVSSTGVDVAYCVRGLKNVAERCQQAQAVLDDDGEPMGGYRFDSSGANGALDKLCKITGAYEKDNEQKNDDWLKYQAWLKSGEIVDSVECVEETL